jgi:small subunit ribosomal protein S20
VDIASAAPPNSNTKVFTSMANSAQARKRARQAVKSNAHNSALRSMMRTAVKAVRKAVAGGDKTVAAEVFKKSMSVIDRVADKKIAHKNKAARDKSRLAAAIKGMGA